MQEIQNLPEEELKRLCEEKRKELFLLRNKLSVEKKLNQAHLLEEKRKEIARVLTQISLKRALRGVHK